MAYQNVGTPVFYMNDVEWLDSLGVISMGSDHFRTLPVNPTPFTSQYNNSPISMQEKSFFAILGHTFASDGVTNIYIPGWSSGIADVVNHDFGCDGFTITKFNGTGLTNLGIFNQTEPVNIGSVVIGTYYEMPHSPDLSLTMEREYGGIKTIETKGGASLSNSFYNGSPKWGSLGVWELNDPTPSFTEDAYLYSGYYNQDLARSGRRIWNLSFSYLDDGDVFGANQYLGSAEWGNQTNNVDTDDVNDYQYYADNLLTDDNFFSQVIHKTNGGQLPFIFQPDQGDNTQFAICKFDQDSFQFKQVAHRVYNMSLKIREVW